LDVEGQPGLTGKPRGVDLRDGNPSLPIVLALARDGELARLFASERLVAADIEAGLARIRLTGVLSAVAERARAHTDAALATLAAGFRKLRLTGGEPTLRADLLEIVARLARLPGLGDLTMTTNGVRLPALAAPLAAAGLRRVNIHLDSLDPRRLARIMRRGTLAEIWAGIEAAEAAGLCPIKLNVVVARGFNEEDVVPLAALTLERPWHARSIATMPLGTGAVAALARGRLVPNTETRARIADVLGALAPVPSVERADEARNY